MRYQMIERSSRPPAAAQRRGRDHVAHRTCDVDTAQLREAG